MFFHLLFKKRSKQKRVQHEYIEMIQIILKSPLWDGSDEQIYQSLPKDLNAETVEYAKNQLNLNDK